jgi:hypothetical protein
MPVFDRRFRRKGRLLKCRFVQVTVWLLSPSRPRQKETAMRRCSKILFALPLKGLFLGLFVRFLAALVSISLIGCGRNGTNANQAEARAPSRNLSLAKAVLRPATQGEPTEERRGQQPLHKTSAPNKPILFQPLFIWDGPENTYQGTGFFAKAPNGKVVAVTSAHFLDRDGPRLLEARWIGLGTEMPIATFAKSWGLPGTEGQFTPGTRPGALPIIDLRSDYLLLPAPESIPHELVQELDIRVKPASDETVWFPNKDPSAGLGYQLVTGKVIGADGKNTGVWLDSRVELQSQSGSPIISQATGKVIGTLSRGSEYKGRTVLWLAPSHAIMAALAKDDYFPLLRDVVGKKAPTNAQK